MTYEEKRAMEITNDLDTIVYDCEGGCVNIYDNVERAVLVGIREGKPKWHDLRKNPDDLPKECQNVLCFCYTGNGYYTVGHMIKHEDDKSWWSNITSKKLYSVIAWCELPKFEEK